MPATSPASAARRVVDPAGAGRYVAAEFEWDILRDHVKAGIASRKDGKLRDGRPLTAAKLVPEMKQLRQEGRSYREIAQRLEVSHASVIRLLRTDP